MKTLISIIFSVLVSFNLFSQLVVIQVNEIQSFVGFSDQTFNEVVKTPFEYGLPEKKDCRYIINMNENRVQFYRDGELIDDGLIEVSTKDGVSVVKFIEGEFNYGLVINPDLQNESVTLFYFYDDKVEYVKFIDFEIVKSI